MKALHGKGKGTLLTIALWVSLLMVFTILIPSILVTQFQGNRDPIMHIKPKVDLLIDEKPSLLIPVYLTQDRKIQSLPLEYYVRGVVAAEMPIEFELEALKAQAVAARTYIVRRALQQDFSNVPVLGAWVTDTVTHQAYLSVEELKRKWGLLKYAVYMEKLNQAVNETKDIIITYQGEPIVATFFSTSNGYTENSEEYWNEYIPYLRSVPSLWDTQISPKYRETVSYPYDDFLVKFGIKPAFTLPVSTGNAMIQVLSTTEGRRIKQVRIGNKTFSGREVRERLSLKSSQFSWTIKDRQIYITTYGYGHGVGMSQWGANGMAMEGNTYTDILSYYYKGVQLESFKPDPIL
ncbi:MAG TPA: stage II sporulation protein D [Bacilli bacterium]